MAGLFTDKHLYSGGRPRSSDIDQDSIGNCYFVATAGAIADQQPERIRIAYDAKTTEFTATLFKDGKRVEYPVTQRELRDNFMRGGGSGYDNRGTGPIWPAVLEVAYAKSLDSNLADGIDEGWRKMSQGGRASAAMYALTGNSGEVLFRATAVRLGTQKTLQQLSDALAENRPITLSTKNEIGFKKDGLANFHAYVVQSAYVDAKGDALLVLRNPWGTNMRNGERTEGPPIKLDDLIRTGGLASFNIGPRPATQDQSAERPSSIGGQSTGLRRVADLLSDMVRALDAPNRDVALAGTMQVLRNSSAGEDFRMQGNLEAMRGQDESVRTTQRLSEIRTQRIGM